MKRSVIVLIGIILVLLLTGVQYLYITTGSTIYVRMLSDAEDQITQNDFPAAQETIEKLDHRFTNSRHILDIFLPHTDVNDIAINLAMLRQYAQLDETEEYLALSAATKRMLLTLSEAQRPSLQNIL